MIEIICYGKSNGGFLSTSSQITGSLYIFYEDEKTSAVPSGKEGGFIKRAMNKYKEHKHKDSNLGKKRDWIPEEEWKAMPDDKKPPRNKTDRKWIPEEKWKAMAPDQRPPRNRSDRKWIPEEEWNAMPIDKRLLKRK